MLENVLRFIIKAGDKEIHLIFPNGVQISDLENGMLQFLQYLGKYKEAQAQAQAQAAQPPAEPSKVEPLPEQPAV